MLTVAEAAVQLGLTQSTVRAWILRRRMRYVKLGRAVRIPKEEVVRLIKENTVPVRRGVGN
jgi:excisionase family DNA binding protein